MDLKVVQMMDPQAYVKDLTKRTVELIREAHEVQTMKDLIRCHDILEVTDEINKPWEIPGFLYGDKAAFQDLYTISSSIMIKADPRREIVIPYVYDVKKLILFWKLCYDQRHSI